MIIVPHNVNSYLCNASDILWDGSASFVSGVSEEGAFVYCTDTNVSYVVLADLTIAPLVINVA